jgi:hypothetical protein
VFKHEPETYGSRIPVDSNWAEEPDRYSSHAGCEFVGSHLIDSWVATDQVRALSSAEAELYGIVDGSARGILTQNLFGELKIEWWVEVECDSSAAIAISSKSGVGKTRHIATRWLWVQDTVRNKQITLQKCKGTENVADMGTKALDGKTLSLLMQQLPLALPQCRRFLGVLAALASLPKAETGAVQLYSSEVRCSVEAEKANHWMMVSATLAVALGTVVVMMLRRMLTTTPTQAAPAPAAAVMKFSVGTQSQTTYTSLRGNLTPRFLPLPEHSHG